MTAVGQKRLLRCLLRFFWRAMTRVVMRWCSTLLAFWSISQCS